MNSKNKSRSRMVFIVVPVLGLILLTAAALPAGAARWLGELARPDLDRTVLLSDTNVAYIGAVELEWGMPGEFSDPLPTPTPDPDPQAAPPPDLGEIDLGLELIRSGDTVTGFVDLEFTLVFTRRHEVNAVWYGPSVEGTFDGTNLTLTSERVSAVIAGKSLMRQFWLTGAVVPDQEGRLSGQYRETLWGYGPQPLTILGTFTLREAIPDLGPHADMGAFPFVGPVPLMVTFSDNSTGDPTGWLWNFGDGGTSTAQNPTHTYTALGSYTVTLTVSNTLGSNTMTKTNYINVVEEDIKIYLPMVLRNAH